MASNAENVSIWWRHHDCKHVEKVWRKFSFYTYDRYRDSEHQIRFMSLITFKYRIIMCIVLSASLYSHAYFCDFNIQLKSNPQAVELSSVHVGQDMWIIRFIALSSNSCQSIMPTVHDILWDIFCLSYLCIISFLVQGKWIQLDFPFGDNTFLVLALQYRIRQDYLVTVKKHAFVGIISIWNRIEFGADYTDIIHI